MRETGQIFAFRSSKAVKQVREVLEAARIFSFYHAFSAIWKVFFVRGTVDSRSFVDGLSWKICVLLQRRCNFEVFLRRVVWGFARGFFLFCLRDG